VEGFEGQLKDSSLKLPGREELWQSCLFVRGRINLFWENNSCHNDYLGTYCLFYFLPLTHSILPPKKT
jgi:hypothetical protein